MNLRSKKKTPPGTLMYTGQATKETTIRHIKYSGKSFKVLDQLEELDDNVVDWIVVEGLTNIDMIRGIGDEYKVDPLVMEDVLHVNQRTKVEVHDNHLFAVFKYPYLNEGEIAHEYVSILLFPNTIMTFTEDDNRFIDDVIVRIENKQSMIRTRSHDYLFYVLFDMIVDEAFDVLHTIEEQLEDIEEDLLQLTSDHQVQLYTLRKELLFLRALTGQIMFNVNHELFTKETYFHKDTVKFYDDVLDHVLNINSKVLTQIDNTKHILDVYMNHMSNKMNQIMTTLTIFSAIFIPLGFLAGVFGMNFVNFPILQNDLGLLYFTLICVFVPTVMLLYFKRKGWF